MERLNAPDFAKGLAIIAIVIFHCYEGLFGWPGHDICAFLKGGLISNYWINLNSTPTVKFVKTNSVGVSGGYLFLWSSLVFLLFIQHVI